jgi:acyl-CoA thioesterase
MTATKTVDVASFAGVFDAEQEERDARFVGKTRRYNTFAHLSDEAYDKDLNARGFFPWLHDHEVYQSLDLDVEFLQPFRWSNDNWDYTAIK